MTSPIKLVLRFLAIVSVLGVISVLLAPASPGNSPYASALSDLTIGPALAAPSSCANTICSSTGAKKCDHNQGTYCHKTNRIPPGGGTGCATNYC